MRFRNFFPQRFEKAETLQIMGFASSVGIPDIFNVLIWNIYKGQMRGWEQDFRALLEDKDLVLLQESVMNTAYDPMFQKNDRMEWVMARTHGHVSTLRSTGVKTGCVVKSCAQSFYVSPDVEPILKTPKMILATSYAMANTNDRLLVVNIHVVNFVSYAKFSRQISQLIEIVEKHDGPVILAGDFNTWSGARYKSLRELAEKMGLAELRMERKAMLQHLNRHLDHVFYKGLDVEETKVLMTVRTSDHYPISVRFKRPS